MTARQPARVGLLQSRVACYLFCRSATSVSSRGAPMIDRKTVPALASAVVLASALGCASASVKSNKKAEYTRKLERTLLVFRVDERMQAFEPLLKERLLAELQKRGVASALAKTGGRLALEDSPPIDKQAKEFNASTVLVILPAGGTVNQYGGIVNARFDAQIFDL